MIFFLSLGVGKGRGEVVEEIVLSAVSQFYGCIITRESRGNHAGITRSWNENIGKMERRLKWLRSRPAGCTHSRSAISRIDRRPCRRWGARCVLGREDAPRFPSRSDCPIKAILHALPTD